MSLTADAVFLHGCAVLTGGGIVPAGGGPAGGGPVLGGPGGDGPAGGGTGLGVLVEGGRIAAVLPAGAAPAGRRQALPPECLLAPGFVDIQVNGGGGVLFNDEPSAEAARHIAAAHRRLGTTGILPTLITSDRATMRRAAEAARGFGVAGDGVLGVHFEGPFLSAARPGVHLASLIRAPDEDDLALLRDLKAASEGAVLVTVAPECASGEVWHRLARAGVVLSAGHTAAAYEDVGPSVTGVTHLFNAMAPPGARAPGVVAAALLSDRYAGVIVDGVHVHPAMLRLMMAAKGAERIMLVSDSMPVAGTALVGIHVAGAADLAPGRAADDHGRRAGRGGSVAGAGGAECGGDAGGWDRHGDRDGERASGGLSGDRRPGGADRRRAAGGYGSAGRRARGSGELGGRGLAGRMRRFEAV